MQYVPEYPADRKSPALVHTTLDRDNYTETENCFNQPLQLELAAQIPNLMHCKTQIHRKSEFIIAMVLGIVVCPKDPYLKQCAFSICLLSLVMYEAPGFICPLLILY